MAQQVLAEQQHCGTCHGQQEGGAAAEGQLTGSFFFFSPACMTIQWSASMSCQVDHLTAGHMCTARGEAGAHSRTGTITNPRRAKCIQLHAGTGCASRQQTPLSWRAAISRHGSELTYAHAAGSWAALGVLHSWESSAQLGSQPLPFFSTPPLAAVAFLAACFLAAFLLGASSSSSSSPTLSSSSSSCRDSTEICQQELAFDSSMKMAAELCGGLCSWQGQQ